VSDCPRCTKPLNDAQVDTYNVRLCQACTGCLLLHPDLMEILDRSWRGVLPSAAESQQFLAPDSGKLDVTLRCPDCHQSMEKYGYMGLTAITIDRCDGCNLLWLDASELQNMLLALAKSNYRSEQRAKRELNEFDPLATGATAPVPSGLGLLGQAIFRQHPGTGMGADVIAQVLLSLLR
jgi:Zn-finger nucleic acid-binding protein